MINGQAARFCTPELGLDEGVFGSWLAIITSVALTPNL
jgi:hypothetical protein